MQELLGFEAGNSDASHVSINNVSRNVVQGYKLDDINPAMDT